ncbi:MAG: hypothetical protein ACHQ1D_02010 [Nitrososphaerales archaeon]
MNAEINNETWSAYPDAFETSVIAIEGSYYYQPSCRLEQVITFIIPTKDGEFQVSNMVDSLTNKAKISFAYMDEDVLLGIYDVPEGKDNGFIKISNYDSSTKRISGSFACSIYLKQNYELPPNHPDSLVIANGQFDTYFRE